MNQSERRLFLIEALLAERPDGAEIAVPADADAQQRLLRALMNILCEFYAGNHSHFKKGSAKRAERSAYNIGYFILLR